MWAYKWGTSELLRKATGGINLLLSLYSCHSDREKLWQYFINLLRGLPRLNLSIDQAELVCFAVVSFSSLTVQLIV